MHETLNFKFEKKYIYDDSFERNEMKLHEKVMRKSCMKKLHEKSCTKIFVKIRKSFLRRKKEVVKKKKFSDKEMKIIIQSIVSKRVKL